MADAISFVRGMKFPFQKVGNQLPAQSDTNTSIADSLRQLIKTQRRTRIMRPSLGTEIMSYVFEPNNVLLEENLKTDIMMTIARNEPRVIVTSVQTKRMDTEISVLVVYIIKPTQQQTSQNFSVPLPEGL